MSSGAFDVFVLWLRFKLQRDGKWGCRCIWSGLVHDEHIVPLCGVNVKNRRILRPFIKYWRTRKLQHHMMLELVEELQWDTQFIKNNRLHSLYLLSEIDHELRCRKWSYTWDGLLKVHVFDEPQKDMGDLDQADEHAIDFYKRWKGPARR